MAENPINIGTRTLSLYSTQQLSLKTTHLIEITDISLIGWIIINYRLKNIIVHYLKFSRVIAENPATIDTRMFFFYYS